MTTIKAHQNDDIFDVARRTVRAVLSGERDVSMEFNGITTVVTRDKTDGHDIDDSFISVEKIIDAHFAGVNQKAEAFRAAQPAYKIARQILAGQPDDVKNALRVLLRVD